MRRHAGHAQARTTEIYNRASAVQTSRVEGAPCCASRTKGQVLNCLFKRGSNTFKCQASNYGSADISGRECTFYRRPRFDNRHPYSAGEAGAQATAQSERTRPWLLANRFQAISQASMMSARLENTELASQ